MFPHLLATPAGHLYIELYFGLNILTWLQVVVLEEEEEDEEGVDESEADEDIEGTGDQPQ